MKCTKERELERLSEKAEHNNDVIIGMCKDIGYIKTSVKEIKENHLRHLKDDMDDLANNYIVFKTKVLVGWGLALIIISVIVSKVIDTFWGNII